MDSTMWEFSTRMKENQQRTDDIYKTQKEIIERQTRMIQYYEQLDTTYKNTINQQQSKILQLRLWVFSIVVVQVVTIIALIITMSAV